MHRISLLLAAVLLLAACESPTDTSAKEQEESYASWVSFGEDIAVEDERLSPAELVRTPGLYDDQLVQIEGDVVAVCTVAGCWMQLENEEGEPLRLHVPRDPETRRYVWTFPTNLVATRAIVSGIPKTDTLSVELQQHYLEDADAPQEEIDAITEPKLTVRLVIDGALLAHVPEAEIADEEAASEEETHADTDIG